MKAFPFLSELRDQLNWAGISTFVGEDLHNI